MSENIRVSEVSDILRQQLEGIETKVQLDEIGTVLQRWCSAYLWSTQCRGQRTT